MWTLENNPTLWSCLPKYAWRLAFGAAQPSSWPVVALRRAVFAAAGWVGRVGLRDCGPGWAEPRAGVGLQQAGWARGTGWSSEWLYNYLADSLGEALSYLPISMDVTAETSETLGRLRFKNKNLPIPTASPFVASTVEGWECRRLPVCCDRASSPGGLLPLLLLLPWPWAFTGVWRLPAAIPTYHVPLCPATAQALEAGLFLWASPVL